MRIISGIHKGRRINAPGNLPVRPTTEFAKESLFNILLNNFDLQKIRVLDLFAGTGNISYEFASRGCVDITSVDIDHRCIRFINKTVAFLKCENIKVIRSDSFKFLNSCKEKFDIIFADPPFLMTEVDRIANRVFENQLLNENGWLIIEHSGNTDLSNLDHFIEKRRYGNVNFSIFRL